MKYLLILLFLKVSTFSFSQTKYIEYHKEITKAQLCIAENDFQKALNHYNKAFIATSNKGIEYDYYNAAKVAAILASIIHKKREFVS